MTDTSPAPEPTVQEQLQALIDRLDQKLALGAEAVAKVDQFYREHDLVPGIGEKILLSDALSSRDREIFRALIAEYQHMEARVRSFEEQMTTAAPRSVGVRAVGNRYRI